MADSVILLFHKRCLLFRLRAAQDFFQAEIFYDPGIAVAPGADTDLLEVELIEAEQVEGKYAQEIVSAEAEEVGQECSVLEHELETDC